MHGLRKRGGAQRAEAHADVSVQAVFSEEAILTDHLATDD